jgi:hypothetical protein
MKHHRPRFRSHFRPRRSAPPQPTRSHYAESLRRLRRLAILQFDHAIACHDTRLLDAAWKDIQEYDELLAKVGLQPIATRTSPIGGQSVRAGRSSRPGRSAGVPLIAFAAVLEARCRDRLTTLDAVHCRRCVPDEDLRVIGVADMPATTIGALVGDDELIRS